MVQVYEDCLRPLLPNLFGVYAYILANSTGPVKRSRQF